MRVASLFSGIGGLDWGLLKVLTDPGDEQVATDESSLAKGCVFCRVAMTSSCSAKVTLGPSKWVLLVLKTEQDALKQLCSAAAPPSCLSVPKEAPVSSRY